MGKRDEIVFFEDILECIEKIAIYLKDTTELDFKNNSEKQDAVIRRIEIIGEAVKSISNETRSNYQNIPWREIAGMRDIVIHLYFGVSIEMIWQVSTNEIPQLKNKIENIISEIS